MSYLYYLTLLGFIMIIFTILGLENVVLQVFVEVYHTKVYEPLNFKLLLY